MNLPNKLTILRICLIPFFVVFAKLNGLAMQIIAVVIYIAACVTDMLDGRIARSQGLVTNFGKFMDPIADKLLVMSALVVLTYQRRMPDWVCILMLAREFLVSGFRLVAVENGVVIAAGPLGKLKTVFQMIATVALMLLVMSALVVLTYQRRMPDWVCILMLAREFLVSGFRLVAVENGVVIAAGPLGKLKTVFQMIATVALMLLVSPTGAHPLGQFGYVLANILMYIALILTVVSGADYILKNKDCIKDM